MSDLRRLVWRFEAGSATALALREEFSEKISSILQRKSNLNDQLSTITRSGVADAARQLFDQAVDDARRSVMAGSFAESLRLFETAAASLLILEQAAAARARIAATSRDRDLLSHASWRFAARTQAGPQT